MGGEQAGRGKQICLCVACLILLNLSACTLSETIEKKVASTGISNTKGKEAREHLERGRKFLTQGDYGNALKENERVLVLAGRRAPSDEALFAIGLIYASTANPARDNGKSLQTFRKLIKDYPQSPAAGQAKAVVGMLNEHDKMSHTIERLNKLIEELKAVDIGLEKKRNEKTR